MNRLEGDLVTVCPLVVPITADLTAYEGYITLQDGAAGAYSSSLWVRLSGLDASTGCCCSSTLLHISEELADILQGYEALLQLRLRESRSVAAFMQELKHLAECAVAARRPPTTPPLPCFYSNLVCELDAIGWQRLVALDPGLTGLTLAVHDAGGRCHEVRVHLPPGYPAAAPELDLDLPLPLEVEWGEGHDLQGAVRQVERALGEFQDVWDCLDDLDQQCWVLEPLEKPPPRGCLHRRLALGGHAALSLTLDPRQPRGPPQNVRFLGAEATVGSLRRQLQQACAAGRWRADRMPRENLEACLGRALPRPEEQQEEGGKEGIAADCCICYAYVLEGTTPDVHCSNVQCSKPFHRSCLVEWLRSDASCRQSFNMLFGECPYCSQAITVQSEGV